MTREFPGATKFKDRHGKWRWRARAKGKKTAMLPGAYRSPRWVEAWNAWANGKVQIGAERTIPGTISALLVKYYESQAYAELADNTRKAYRAALERFRAKNGHKSIEGILCREEIVSALARMKPEPANMLLRCFRQISAFAVTERLLASDPTTGLKKRRNHAARKGGIYTWTLEDVAKFEACHPFGSKARLALDLLLYTAQRKSDVVRLGRQHEQEGGTLLSFKQMKTGEDLVLPIVGPLRASIDASPTGDLAYLVTGAGKPFTPAGFGNWFREQCDKAALPQCSSHGLRKATATRLADEGKSPHEIMSVTGHRSLSEVDRYTRAANKRRMARQSATVLALAKLPLANLTPGLPSGAKKTKK